MTKPNRINFKKSQKGVGLIEVLATILITVIGLVGLAAMQLKSVRANQNANQKAQAIWIVSDMANRIRANSQGDYTSSTTFRCDDSTTPNPTNMCSYIFRNNAQVPAANCDTDDLVTFDKREVLCGFSQTTPPGTTPSYKTYPNAASFLADRSMIIQTTANNRISIQLNWSQRDAQSSNSNTQQVEMVIYK